MKKIDVSVIVLTYKPDWNKFRCTLNSILAQTDVDYEIIICDDGSVSDYRENAEKLLSEYSDISYTYVKNHKNVGTVKNYLSGLRRATGKYVFGISPGDMLFDSITLKNMFDFCENKGIKICFGDAVYYNHENGKLNVFSGVNAPKRPSVYAEGKPFAIQKRMFFNGEGILGVTYFKERKCALECFERIENYAIYMEDKCSTAVAFVKGYKVVHFPKKIVWYEKGSGISTSGNDEWGKKLSEDYNRTICSLKKEYPDDHVIDVVYIRKKYTNKLKKLVAILFKHPLYFIFKIYRKFVKIEYTEASDELKEQLKAMF